jgi:hypothetical protein
MATERERIGVQAELDPWFLISGSGFGSLDEAERYLSDLASRAGFRWARILLKKTSLESPSQWGAVGVTVHRSIGDCPPVGHIHV